MNVNLKSLIGRLDETCRIALEGAAGLCLSRTNYDVEIEHILAKFLESDNTDFHKILRHYEINAEKMSRDVSVALDRLKTGNSRNPSLSPRLPRWISDAWLLASVEFGASKVRSGHLILALLTDDGTARIATEISKQFTDIIIKLDNFKREFTEIVAGSIEDKDAASLSETSTNDNGEQVAGVPKSTKALDQYTEDLTAKARAGKIDPILGRDAEIRQVIDILTRRRQNNPILTGEAGVGKTAVAEGFAIRIAEGDVPEPLRGVALRTLDLGLLQAGAGIKGEFENRLKSVIDEVKSSPQPIILFIDEAHTLIGAGGAAGQNDAANLLKPALARGELRTIAATTWAEYKKYFEKDAALARRFQTVKVEEPDEEKAVAMMRGLVEKMEAHHNVRILNEAVVDCVKLSHRYISGRQLPDKSVSVLDTACAKVAIGQGATPASVEDSTRRITRFETEINALKKEATTGTNHVERLDELTAKLDSENSKLSILNEQWTKEKELISKIKEIRSKLESEVTQSKTSNTNGHAEATKVQSKINNDGTEVNNDDSNVNKVDSNVNKVGTEDNNDDANVNNFTSKDNNLLDELALLNAELKQVQGENPLMQAVVNGQTVAEVISGWTGIPVGKMLSDEINAVLTLHEKLGERVIGQNHALESISQRIRTARAGLTDPKRPVGVFLLVGTSGVGKTETALALADTLFGGERNLVSINMSEYQEAHTVSSLKGSPPGYVGYGEGGVLTEAVRRKPYSVVLLDEVEKAHPDVMELFYQVFDKGMLEDGEGREIDFKNTIILLTSNVATNQIMAMCNGKKPQPEEIIEAIRPELIDVFKPALLGRMVVVPFYPISDDVLREIIKIQLGKIKNRIFENHRAQFSYDESVIESVASRCTEVESGARNVYNILTGTLLPQMSGEVLSRIASGDGLKSIHVANDENGNFSYQIN
ncbi:MAG: type VI secretion system ATPase TssH [Pyrinomonadaceae bacterium]|nr:type VI secretion system ATPase TssH [Pyrinomonadaceae bacterium]